MSQSGPAYLLLMLHGRSKRSGWSGFGCFCSVHLPSRLLLFWDSSCLFLVLQTRCCLCKCLTLSSLPVSACFIWLCHNSQYCSTDLITFSQTKCAHESKLQWASRTSIGAYKLLVDVSLSVDCVQYLIRYVRMVILPYILSQKSTHEQSN